MTISRFFISTLTVALFATKAFAVASLPSSGTCGFNMAATYPFTGVQLITAADAANGPLNFLGTLTFTSASGGTFALNMVNQKACGFTSTNSNGGSTCPGNAVTYTNSQSQVTGTFTVGAGPISNSSALTLSPSGGGSTVVNAIATNNGNTILLQKFDSTSTSGHIGVCQF